MRFLPNCFPASGPLVVNADPGCMSISYSAGVEVHSLRATLALAGKLFPNPQSSPQPGNSGDRTCRELGAQGGALNPHVRDCQGRPCDAFPPTPKNISQVEPVQRGGHDTHLIFSLLDLGHVSLEREFWVQG